MANYKNLVLILSKTFCWLWTQKLPTMVLAWENLLEVFVMLVVISFLIFISFPGYFTMSPAFHSGFSGPWRPPPALRSTPTTFDCLFFFIYRERYAFEWAFFTHRRFLSYASSWHFWHNLLLSRPPWEPSVLPWSFQGFILILKTQTRPICLFDLQ